MIQSAPEETVERKPDSSDYITLSIPKLRFKDTPLAPLWVFLLIIFSFLLGMLTTKVQYLQMQKSLTTPVVNTAQNQQVAARQSISNETIKQWAQELSLNTVQFTSCFDDQKYASKIEKDTTDAQEAEATATPTFYINGIQLIGAQPYSVFKKTIDEALAGTPDTAATSFEVTVGGLPAQGNKTAPITIVEFSDFECPFCLRFYTDTYGKLKKDYIDTGKVVLYYRHLPLPMHTLAVPFAHAAECANEQGKFWQMHDKIFEEQRV